MSKSYEKLQKRIVDLEGQVDFLMTFLRQPVCINDEHQHGPDGQPVVSRRMVSMGDLYKGVRSGQVKIGPPPQPQAAQSSALASPPPQTGPDGKPVGPDLGYETPEGAPKANFYDEDE